MKENTKNKVSFEQDASHEKSLLDAVKEKIREFSYQLPNGQLAKLVKAISLSFQLLQGKNLQSAYYPMTFLNGIWTYNIAYFLRGRKSEGTFNLGEHGSIKILPYYGKTKELEDGTIIEPSSPIGVIDLSRNLRIGDEKASFSFSRVLSHDFVDGLLQTIKMLEGESAPDVVALTGISHLAGLRLAEKIGFETEDPAFEERVGGAITGITLNTEKNIWKLMSPKFLKKRWNRTQKVWISIPKLMKQKEALEKLSEEFKRKKEN